MSNTLESKINFPVLFQKLFQQEHAKTISSIINNNETLSYEIEINEKLNEKFAECFQLMDNLKSVSSEFNFTESEAGVMKIDAKPIKGNEIKYNNLLKEVKKCKKKLEDFDVYHQRIFHLTSFCEMSLQQCVKNHCEVSSTEEEAVKCIKDCFKYDTINRITLIPLMNDQNLKLLKEIDKAQI